MASARPPATTTPQPTHCNRLRFTAPARRHAAHVREHRAEPEHDRLADHRARALVGVRGDDCSNRSRQPRRPRRATEARAAAGLRQRDREARTRRTARAARPRARATAIAPANATARVHTHNGSFGRCTATNTAATAHAPVTTATNTTSSVLPAAPAIASPITITAPTRAPGEHAAEPRLGRTDRDAGRAHHSLLSMSAGRRRAARLAGTNEAKTAIRIGQRHRQRRAQPTGAAAPRARRCCRRPVPT